MGCTGCMGDMFGVYIYIYVCVCIKDLGFSA